MALLGKLVNSRDDWNINYLHELREQFLQQEYPLTLINEQFSRALSVDRADLHIIQNTRPEEEEEKSHCSISDYI